MKQNENLYRKQLSEVDMPQFRFIGVMLMAAGGFMLWYLNPIGLLLFIVGICLVFIRDGIEIRMSERQFRSYYSVFTMMMGKWKPLPEIEYITIFNERVNQEAWVSSIRNNLVDKHVKVALVYGNNQQLAVGIFESKVKAVETATDLAKQLGVRLLDYTTKDPVWIIE